MKEAGRGLGGFGVRWRKIGLETPLEVPLEEVLEQCPWGDPWVVPLDGRR